MKKVCLKQTLRDNKKLLSKRCELCTFNEDLGAKETNLESTTQRLHTMSITPWDNFLSKLHKKNWTPEKKVQVFPALVTVTIMGLV